LPTVQIKFIEDFSILEIYVDHGLPKFFLQKENNIRYFRIMYT